MLAFNDRGRGQNDRVSEYLLASFDLLNLLFVESILGSLLSSSPKSGDFAFRLCSKAVRIKQM